VHLLTGIRRVCKRGDDRDLRLARSPLALKEARPRMSCGYSPEPRSCSLRLNRREGGLFQISTIRQRRESLTQGKEPQRPWAACVRLAALISPILDHLDLVVSSLERSVPFYQGLLGSKNRGEIVGERGERVVYIAPPGSDPIARTVIGLRSARRTLTPSPTTATRSASTMWPSGQGPALRSTTALRGCGRKGRPSRAARKNTRGIGPATTRSSSTTRTGSSSRSSTFRPKVPSGSSSRRVGLSVRPRVTERRTLRLTRKLPANQ
jgi:hypothetical protein